MRLRPTRRLPGMVLAAGVIYLFATNSQVVWLYLVSALVLAIALVGLVAPAVVLRRLNPRLEGHRREGFHAPLAQDHGRLFAGDRLTLVIDLGTTAPPVELGPARCGGRSVPVQGQVSGAWGLAELEAGPRGRLRIDAVRLATSWPLGIARASRWVPVAMEPVVHPRYALPRDQRRQGSREPSGISARRGAGDEFLGLREYRSGDSQRRIHWPTTARAGSLMVVETAEESSNSGTYELELGADATPEAADLAVALTASLGAANIAGGIPLAMGVPGQARHLHRWSEALAALATAGAGEAPPSRHGRDAARVAAAGRQVSWSRGESSQVLDAATPLEEALAAIGGRR